MVETNTFYNCECVYYVDGYIACEICAKWVQNAAKAEPNDEPILLAKRWSRKSDNNKNKRKIAGWL